MDKPTYSELIALLQRSHDALEAVTDRVGCSFPVAVVLVDCENGLAAAKAAAPAKKPAKGLSLVH